VRSTAETIEVAAALLREIDEVDHPEVSERLAMVKRREEINRIILLLKFAYRCDMGGGCR
jgi:predicted protein tyrosine phosphatase